MMPMRVEGYDDEEAVAEIVESRGEKRKTRKKLCIAAVCLIIGIIVGVAAIKSRSKASPSSATLTSDSAGDKAGGTVSSTPSPTPKATPSPTSETTDIDYGKDYNCRGERFNNEKMEHLKRLRSGHYMCSHKAHRYMFGMTADGGVLVWRDNKADETVTYFEGEIGDYFMLSINGTFIVRGNDDSIKWKREPLAKFQPIGYSEKCYANHDCPYLHLHSDGVLVLNWIDDDDGWQEINFKHVFGF